MENNGISIKISLDTYKKIKGLAKKEGRFISVLIDKALKNYLKAKKVIEA